MSKFVKKMMMADINRRLEGVGDALLVDVVGMEANNSTALRKTLREKNIQMLVVKNSVARKACEGTVLANAFDNVSGSIALVWGSEDFVSLCKEVSSLDKNDKIKHFQAKGGVMDGDGLTPETVHAISKWPNRAEQLSLLSGQMLSCGANLSAALLGPGRMLNSQIEQKSKEKEEVEG